jgi:hypothetical protein
MRSRILPFVADPAKYQEVVSVGFGLWLDYQWPRYGWNPLQPATNYFTPDAFALSVRAALDAADEYVWVYTETPRWWSQTGRVALSDDYVRAIDEARQAGRGRPVVGPNAELPPPSP